MKITAHAAQRYRERIEPVDDAQARSAIRAAAGAIDIAAEFGANVVVMGNGARLILDGDTVVTVIQRRRGKHPVRVHRPARFEWVG